MTIGIFKNVLMYDVETTIYKHQLSGEINVKDRAGSAFSLPQELVMSGFKWAGKHSQTMYHCNVVCSRIENELLSQQKTQKYFDRSTLIVGFNIKFDLHWARRIGVDISAITVWDCQLAEFILGCQQPRYPSMTKTAQKYGLSTKLDVVEKEYWDNGIDTDAVPVDILQEYLARDLLLTEQIFNIQKDLLCSV